MFLPPPVCLCVCVPVNKISQKHAHCFECALQGIVIRYKGRTLLILVRLAQMPLSASIIT